MTQNYHINIAHANGVTSVIRTPQPGSGAIDNELCQSVVSRVTMMELN